jgi:hypothetical protein
MTDKKPSKYAKLLGKIDYDHEAVEQLAEALNEITEAERHVAQLKQIVAENEELHQFVWRDASGVTTPIHKIDDDHLSNIMLHLLRRGDAIPRAIRGEAIARELVIPVTVPIDWEDDTMRRLSARLDRSDV